MKYLIGLGVIVLVQYSNAQVVTAPVRPVLVQEQCTKPTAPDTVGKNAQQISDEKAQYEKLLAENFACEDRNVKNLNIYSEQIVKFQEDMKKYLAATTGAAPTAQDTKSAYENALSAYKQSLSAAAEANRSADENRRISTRYYILAAAAPLGAAAFIPLAIHYGSESRRDSTAKDQFNRAAADACKALLQLSPNGATSCDNLNPEASGAGALAQNDKPFDSNGKCLGSKTECAKFNKDLSQAGLNIKDLQKSISNFASGSNALKINSDGSVTTKDGKTFVADKLNNEAALIASGMSLEDAKALMAKIKKNSAPENDASSKVTALTVQSPNVANYIDNASTTNNSKTTEVIINGNASNQKNLLGGGGKRAVASAEGLVKDFNGEQIGVAGDDIFKMVNRRYKLKVAQDNFVAP